MGKDLYNKVTAEVSLAPATRTADADGTSVDRAQNGDSFQSALVVVATGTITDGTHTIEVQESDDDATFTAVADDDLQGTEPEIGSDDDNTVFEIGYIGTARFLRVSVTAAGTTSGGDYTAVVVLGDPRVAPPTR